MWGVIVSAVVAAAGEADASKARKAGRQNEANVYAENTETIRKTLLSQQQTLGQAKASYGASGVSLESESVQGYLATMKDNFQKDMDWLKKARTMGVKVEAQRGANAASTIRTNTLSNAISTGVAVNNA